MARLDDLLGRRAVLAGVGALGYGAVVAHVWTNTAPGRGRIEARELSAAGETLLYHGEDRIEVGGVLSQLGDDDPAEISVAEHSTRLREEHGEPTYRILIADGDDGEWLTTGLSVFETVAPGDYVTYQVRFFDSRYVQTLSCVAPDAETLETRCEYEGVDITE